MPRSINKRLTESKYDEQIEDLFLKGVNLKEIAKALSMDIMTVKFRIKKCIFPNKTFKVRWYSYLSNKWMKISTKSYDTPKQLKMAVNKIKKYCKTDKIQIIPVDKGQSPYPKS